MILFWTVFIFVIVTVIQTVALVCPCKRAVVGLQLSALLSEVLHCSICGTDNGGEAQNFLNKKSKAI